MKFSQINSKFVSCPSFLNNIRSLIMEVEQLYVLDVYVNKIILAPRMVDIPRKEDINVLVSFSNFVNMNIKPDNLVPPAVPENILCSANDDITLNIGKSQAFYSDPENLQKHLKNAPVKLLLTAQTSGDELWEVNLPFTSDFMCMVGSSKNASNQLIPAAIEKVQDIRNMNGQVIGQIDVFLRLSCFGAISFEQFKKIPRARIALEDPLHFRHISRLVDEMPLVILLVGLIFFSVFLITLYMINK